MLNNIIIDPSAKIAKNVHLSDGVIIGKNVVIGDDSFIDYGVIIRDNVSIGANSFIGARCILGEYTAKFMASRNDYTNAELVIGNNALIRSEAILYSGSQIGNNFQTGHRVTIREKSNIGNNVRIGTLSDVQGHCNIGNYVNFHSNVHIGQKSEIDDYVWIFPYVVLTNDPTPPSSSLIGVKVEKFAVIATMSVILPGVTVKEGSLVGAGSIVNKDVPPEMVVVGNPAKEIMPIRNLKNKITGENVYPWRYTFDHGMPWQGIGYDEWVKNS